MYQDLKKMLWQSGMKKEVVKFTYACLVCWKAKVEHQKPLSLLQPTIIYLSSYCISLVNFNAFI